MFDINAIMEMSKERLLESGEAGHRILAEKETPQGLALVVMPLIWNGEKEKIEIRSAVKKTLKMLGVKRYWFATEIWMSRIDSENPDKIYVKPSRDAARQEAISVQEYSEDGKHQTRLQMFRHTNDNKIEFYDYLGKMQLDSSYWNIWEDEDAMEKKDDIMIKQINETFIRNMAHKISEKYKEEFFASDDPEYRMKILRKIIAEGEEEKKKMNQKILEDTDEKRKF